MDKLVEAINRVAPALEKSHIPYQVAGSLAAFLHVDEADPSSARLTTNADVVVNCRSEDLQRAIEALGFSYEHAHGGYVLLDRRFPATVVTIRLCAWPQFPQPARVRGVMVTPVADLVRMKLTSFRLKDKVHIQDMDGVGLITSEIEQTLPEALRQRLAEVRATE